MKFAVLAAAAFACLTPAVASAQTAPAAPAPAATPVAKFNLDTPIEALAADEGAKAVLMADLPDVLPHPSYEMFKGMSLRQVAPYSEGKITDEVLKKVEADLAAVK